MGWQRRDWCRNLPITDVYNAARDCAGRYGAVVMPRTVVDGGVAACGEITIRQNNVQVLVALMVGGQTPTYRHGRLVQMYGVNPHHR